MFKFGPATDGFDFETSYIDLQLLVGIDEPMGNPLRYSATNLADTIIAEIHMIVCRITPMAPITGIRANHSSPGLFWIRVIFNLIYFYS